MANWLKILLFGGGVAVAGIGTAYLGGALDPRFQREQAIVAALPEAEPLAEPAALQVEGEDEADAPSIAVEDATAVGDGEELVVPAFDVVRVEPDGSMVIAGRAAPGAAIEVLTGTRVIASVEVGGDGDFAAVLDEPLAAGDYQIVLRSTTEENVVATSVETAIVSIPETADGQVLALVEEPGSPSRLITVPEASEAQPLEEEPDLADVSEEEPLTETAAAEASEEAAPEAVADGERQDASQAAVAETTPETQQPAETDVAEAAANGGAEEEGAVAIEEEATPDIAEAEAAVQPVDEVETVTELETEQDVASLQESESEVTASPAPAGDALVFVEAVEIDGGTVFVAGYAEPGRFVRVYANEILLGEVRVSEAGRFLIEAEVDLPVGDYIIRADLLGSDGSVVARAAVPFEREPGETIAAIAPRTPVAQPRADEPEQVAEEDVRVETAETQAEDGERAPDIATAPIDEDGDVAEVVPGSETPGVTEPEEIEAAADAQAADELEEAATTAEGVAGEPVHADQPDAASQAEEHREAAAEPALSPALERVDGAVIIRRGDNLWRISRRVYGQGIRYSTIYLANQEQIRNPDLIWPGQVFTVPAETVEGEAADLEALGEQAVDPSQVPGEIIR